MKELAGANDDQWKHAWGAFCGRHPQTLRSRWSGAQKGLWRMADYSSVRLNTRAEYWCNGSKEFGTADVGGVSTE